VLADSQTPAPRLTFRAASSQPSNLEREACGCKRKPQAKRKSFLRYSSLDPVKDRRKAKHVEREIEIESFDLLPTRSAAVRRYVLRFAGDGERLEILAAETTDDMRCIAPPREAVSRLKSGATAQAPKPKTHASTIARDIDA
jgi:hypothetical protein